MSAPETVLVGTDGSEQAQTAVRWAAIEAERRGATLRIVHAYDEVWGPAGGPPPASVLDAAHNHAEEIVAEARLVAKGTAPSLTVYAGAVLGDPGATLLEAAATADLVVVGSRGRGGFTSLLLGSTSQRVAVHAPCLAVTQRVWDADGSAGGAYALEMGFEAAALRHTSVVAVRTFHIPTSWTPGLPVVLVTLDECAAAETDALAGLLAPYRDRFPGVTVTTQVSCNDAARVLVGASHTAQLVVVGSRGLGVFAGTLLGAVGVKLLHHSDCPVLIARG